MSKSISELVNDLPRRSITTYALESLDFVVPGEWENINDFNLMVQQVTGETDPALVQAVIKRADELYADPDERYQRAMWLYQITDKTDKGLAAAALADKVGERIGFLSFLSRMTPKADRAQTMDLSLKLVVELLTFCLINGIPGDSIGDFVESLADYGQESLMRMAALTSLDGLVPLGADFANIVVNTLDKMSPDELAGNTMYKRIESYIPGDDPDSRLAFVHRSFESVTGWITNFITERDLTSEKVTSSLQKYIDVTDNRLDYMAAFLDLTTNYYTHTGTQNVGTAHY